MKIFLSWSGGNSRALATFLRDWLPKAVPGVSAWMSDRDIPKGIDWFKSLMESLGTTDLSIICVTPENLLSPWIHFETGCLTAKLDNTRICPYLTGLTVGELSRSPLLMKQCTIATKEDTWRLIQTINEFLGENRHNPNLLATSFELNWPALENMLNEITSALKTSWLPIKYASEMYTLGSLVIPYIPVHESREKGKVEYLQEEIKIEIDPQVFQLPSAFANNPTSYYKDVSRCGVSRFTSEQLTHSLGHPATFTFRKVSYEDYLKSANYLDCSLPDNPNKTFRDEYAPSLNPRELYYSLSLTNLCGVGIFILTNDKQIVFSHRSAHLLDLPEVWSYSASGSMNWNDPPDLFGEARRESEEEINYIPGKDNFKLFAIGIDPKRLVFQCSFYEETNLSAYALLNRAKKAKATSERLLIAKPFEVDTIAALVRSRKWEPATAAGLLTLASKWFGEDKMKAALSQPVI